jgi:hypothetical protein
MHVNALRAIAAYVDYMHTPDLALTHSLSLCLSLCVSVALSVGLLPTQTEVTAGAFVVDPGDCKYKQ